MKFLSDILNQRLTEEDQSALNLSTIYHGDNNIFIKFIEIVIKDLEKLLQTS